MLQLSGHFLSQILTSFQPVGQRVGVKQVCTATCQTVHAVTDWTYHQLTDWLTNGLTNSQLSRTGITWNSQVDVITIYTVHYSPVLSVYPPLPLFSLGIQPATFPTNSPSLTHSLHQEHKHTMLPHMPSPWERPDDRQEIGVVSKQKRNRDNNQTLQLCDNSLPNTLHIDYHSKAIVMTSWFLHHQSHKNRLRGHFVAHHDTVLNPQLACFNYIRHHINHYYVYSILSFVLCYSTASTQRLTWLSVPANQHGLGVSSCTV